MSHGTGEVQPVEVRRPVTDFDLEAFRCQLVDLFNRERMSMPDAVTVKRGRKYVRIFHGTSIYCFIEKATGDILKPEGLKKPAKHPRGNIHNKDALACCGPYGVAYLK